MSDEIRKKYRVFREEIEYEPDIDYSSASCYILPSYILIKKQREKKDE